MQLNANILTVKRVNIACCNQMSPKMYIKSCCITKQNKNIYIYLYIDISGCEKNTLNYFFQLKNKTKNRIIDGETYIDYAYKNGYI